MKPEPKTDELQEMFVDAVLGRVHLSERGIRVGGIHTQNKGNRAPKWAKLAYEMFGDGSAGGFGSDNFVALVSAAENYVRTELGWRWQEGERRGVSYLACPCGINVNGDSHNHLVACVLPGRDEEKDE